MSVPYGEWGLKGRGSAVEIRNRKILGSTVKRVVDCNLPAVGGRIQRGTGILELDTQRGLFQFEGFISEASKVLTADAVPTDTRSGRNDDIVGVDEVRGRKITGASEGITGRSRSLFRPWDIRIHHSPIHHGEDTRIHQGPIRQVPRAVQLLEYLLISCFPGIGQPIPYFLTQGWEQLVAPSGRCRLGQKWWSSQSRCCLPS